MENSAKLKTAMAEIDAIIKKYDIAAYVLLHSPGYVEHAFRLSPSYSCVTFGKNEFVMKIDEAVLPGGREQAKKLATETYKMLTVVSDMMAIHANIMIDCHEVVTSKWAEIGRTMGKPTPNDPKDN